MRCFCITFLVSKVIKELLGASSIYFSMVDCEQIEPHNKLSPAFHWAATGSSRERSLLGELRPLLLLQVGARYLRPFFCRNALRATGSPEPVFHHISIFYNQQLPFIAHNCGQRRVIVWKFETHFRLMLGNWLEK